MGTRSLSEAELLAILLRSGTRSKSALDMAKELLQRYDNSLAAVAKLSVHELMKVKGIGDVKAVTIAAALEQGGWPASRFEIVARGEEGASAGDVVAPMRRRAHVVVRASAAATS